MNEFATRQRLKHNPKREPRGQESLAHASGGRKWDWGNHSLQSSADSMRLRPLMLV